MNIDLRKRPSQERSRHTVDAILEAAARILEAGGLQALTTNTVAERAGVSPGSLYQYFPDKHAILAELIRRERAKLFVCIDALTARKGRRPLEADVRALVRIAVAHQLGRPALARALEYAEAWLPMAGETALLADKIADRAASLLARHRVPKSRQAARDAAALAKGMIDAAGLAGEADADALSRRVFWAVTGYLTSCRARIIRDFGGRRRT